MGSKALTFRPYIAGDAAMARYTAGARVEFPGLISGIDADRYYRSSEVAESALRDDQVISCAGIFYTWPGRFVAWAVFSEMTLREWVQVRRRLRRQIEACPGPRIEATARVAFPQARGFLEQLGFECEGRLKLFAGGEDYWQMARVMT